jgi:hypothetical protein
LAAVVAAPMLSLHATLPPAGLIDQVAIASLAKLEIGPSIAGLTEKSGLAPSRRVYSDYSGSGHRRQ